LEGWKGRCSLMGMGTVRSGLMRCRLPGTCEGAGGVWVVEGWWWCE
jgi:hypothetical protein